MPRNYSKETARYQRRDIEPAHPDPEDAAMEIDEIPPSKDNMVSKKVDKDGVADVSPPEDQDI